MPSVSELIEEAHAIHSKGVEEKDGELIEEALNIYRNLLNQNPDCLPALFLAATAEMQLGREGVAINLLQRCLQLGRNHHEIWNNLGGAWRALHKIHEAERAFLKAASLPGGENSEVYNNLATLFINEGNPDPAVDYARKAIKLEPTNSKAHWNLGLAQLEQQNWARGFREYEWGLASRDRMIREYGKQENKPPFAVSRVQVKGARVVVYGEQGLGDEIMYASALSDLIEDAAEVVYDCHDRLEDTMKRSFPIEIHPTRKKAVIKWPYGRTFDYKLAIGSLFHLYRSDGKFPRLPYLMPDPVLVSSMREYLESLGPGPYIGIGWQGGSRKTHEHHRSLKLGHIKPLLHDGATFVSVQYSDVAEKIARFNVESPITLHHIPDVVRDHNYDCSIALAAALDLVIVPNTTMVHVCGAIGTKCWSWTPKACAWRYSGQDENMVFYGDHVRLWRQGEEEDMHGVIARMGDAVADFIRDFSS